MEVKLEQIKGIGPAWLRVLRNEGIWSTYDLVLRVPKSYEDFTIRSLSSAKDLEKLTVQGKVISALKENPYGKVHLTTFRVKINDIEAEVIAFNKSYLIKQISEGSEVLIKGVYHLYQKKIVANYIAKVTTQMPIKPVYKIEGMYDRNIQHIVSHIFEQDHVQIYEIIPKEFIDKYHLINRKEAYRKLHLPKNFDDIKEAERRFKYEEAFFLQLKLVANQLASSKRKPKLYHIEKVRDLIHRLPFELTMDQKQATNDIFKDFKRDYSGIRLIQGDVGSGKTVVALIASYAVVTANEQVAIMAPTTLLAEQHYHFFKSILKDLNIALLTQNTANKNQLKEEISKGNYDIVIGTQALIESDVVFKHLGFVVIDEQHKFGVDARQTLIEKGHAKDVLYLTATPIPRTLAMVSFGESNVSTIKEKPSQRQPVITKLMDSKNEQKVFDMITKTVLKKEHVFVIVPAITSDQVSDNIKTTQEKLTQLKLPLFVLHGQLSKDEQNQIMRDFKQSPGGVLLSTTMIEVGIDIPTATLMIILSAHQFGLAQLHQLRGRIGRGTLASTCYLVSEKQDLERLALMTKTNDGFVLSEYDLMARGPGDFIGAQQSGYLNFHFLDLSTDENILREAQKNVLSLFEKPDFDSNVRYQYLRKHIKDSLKI